MYIPLFFIYHILEPLARDEKVLFMRRPYAQGIKAKKRIDNTIFGGTENDY